MNLNEYAKHRKDRGLKGTTHVAIIRAIESGRLDGNAARRDGRRWVIDPQEADRQWAANTDGKTRGSGNGPADLTAESPLPSSGGGVPNLSYSKAVREAYMARLAAIQYEREAGSRVLRAEVEKAAFELARRVREQLMNIPDRVSFDIAAETNPTKVHLILSDAITDALTELTDA